jgi:hypothetical protein
MLVFTPFVLCFVTLRGIFMRFLELTYWQDDTVPVPVFCYFCVLEKLHRKYSRNWTKQVQELLFFLKEDRRPNESRRGARGFPHHEGAQPRPWPHPPMVRPPWSPPDDAPSPIRSLLTENPKAIGKISRTGPQRRRCWRQILGDISLCSGTLPRQGSAPEAISISLHCRLRYLHRPHRHLHQPCCLLWWGGSSSPPGLRALSVAMCFTSLSHDVIFMWSWALYLVELVDVIIQILCYSYALYL